MKTSLLGGGEPVAPQPQVAQVRKLENSLRAACLLSAVCLAALALVGYGWLSSNILRPWLGDGANWPDAVFSVALLPAGLFIKHRIYTLLTKYE